MGEHCMRFQVLHLSSCQVDGGDGGRNGGQKRAWEVEVRPLQIGWAGSALKGELFQMHRSQSHQASPEGVK